MSFNKRLFMVCSTALLITACSKFPGSQYLPSNQRQNDVVVLKDLKAVKPTLKTTTAWKVNTGSSMGENKIHPYLDNRTVYIAGGTSASAWQRNNGQATWKTNIGETISAGINGTLLNNPQRDNTTKPLAEQVFLGTSSGNAIALDAKTGKIQWIERLSSEVLSVSPSDQGRVAFRTVDGKLHGLSSTTGELIWQRSQSTTALTQLGAGVPVIVANMIVAGFDNGKLAAYDLQRGNTLWEHSLGLPSGNSAIEQIVDVDGRIEPLGNALFAASMNGSSVGINMETGKKVWSRAFSSPTGVEASAQALFTSDSEGNVWGIEPQTGNPAWSMDDLKGREPSVPIIVGSSTIVVTDIQGNIHWIDPLKGNFIARDKGDLAGYSVAPVSLGKELYLIGKSGLLSKHVLAK